MIRRLLSALVVVSALGVSGCATSAIKQGEHADELHNYDEAVASYTRALREHPNDIDAELGLERAKLRASNAHLAAGRHFMSEGRNEDALLELQIAAELNPTDADAAADLQRVRAAIRTQVSRSDTTQTNLESIISRTQDLAPAGFDVPDVVLPAQIATGQQTTTRAVYILLARLGSLSVTFDSQFADAPAPVSLLNGMHLKPALDLVAQSTRTFYQVTGPASILVASDTPAKRREYTNEVMRQFVVQNADLKETLDALRVVADARYIAQVSGTNTILVRDTPERVQAIGRFLAEFDRAKPEVVVDVEVLEVARSRLQEYGLQIASPGSPGIDGAIDVNQPNGISLQALRDLTSAGVLMTNIPALYYRLLKTDVHTRTLANPHIRISDGTTSTARFGEDVPVPRLTITPVSQGGPVIQPQTEFDYRTIGVNIGITPRTHPNDEVSLSLNIELSSLGETAGYNGLPTFGSRNVTTSIRLKDGETNILAGLIKDEERTEKDTIPGLGDMPVLGHLFAKNHNDRTQTDVVVMLTPHIVRELNLTDDDMRPLRLPSEGSASSVIFEPTPVQQSIPITPQPAPPAAPVPTAPPPTAPATIGGQPTPPPNSQGQGGASIPRP